MQKQRVMIISADLDVSQHLQDQLQAHGLDPFHSDGRDIADRLAAKAVDIVLACTHSRRIEDGLQAVKQIRRQQRLLPVVLLTRYSSESRALAAFRAGVNDYHKLPVSVHSLLTSIQKLVGSRSAAATESMAPLERSCKPPCPVIIGNSRSMREMKAYLRKVAAAESTVFITGETGTGKELAAEMVHRSSSRQDRPFVRINCAAIPDGLAESEIFGYERGAFTGAVAAKPGKFELAEGGSVLLDEIGDMCALAQAKILRTIERKEISRLGGKTNLPVDVRVIAATNREPEELMAEGRFRKDLFYRLNVARVQLPPLRERKEDIPPLLAHFIARCNRKFGRRVEGFSDHALNCLFNYDWPGNVRELKNLVEAAFINLPSHPIRFMDLPRLYREKLKNAEGMSHSERDRLLSVLFATNWNKSKTARKLHWSRMTVYRKMQKYRLEKTSSECK